MAEATAYFLGNIQTIVINNPFWQDGLFVRMTSGKSGKQPADGKQPSLLYVHLIICTK